MKEISELNFPIDVRHAIDHEWARLEGNEIKIGINDYAQDQLGDVVFVELPAIGAHFKAGEAFGTVESVKAVVELFMPISGKIIAINSELESAPELVNSNPYDGGWMILVVPDNLNEFENLMDRDTYLTMLCRV